MLYQSYKNKFKNIKNQTNNTYKNLAVSREPNKNNFYTDVKFVKFITKKNCF